MITTEQTIKAWLEGPRDYQEGVELLRQIGAGKFLIQRLARANNQHNLNQIISRLSDHLPDRSPKLKASPPAQEISAPAQEISAPPQDISAPPPPADEIIRKIDALWVIRRKHYNERAQLSNQLLQQPTDASRLVIVKQIQALDLEIDALKAQIEALETGQALQEEEEAPSAFVLPTDKAELITLRNQLRSQRSKAIANLAKFKGKPKEAVYQNKLEHIDAKLKAIESAL